MAEPSETVVRRNLIAMNQTVTAMRKEYDQRISHMENVLNTIMTKFGELEGKYNLLLTKRFDRGSTSE